MATRSLVVCENEQCIHNTYGRCSADKVSLQVLKGKQGTPILWCATEEGGIVHADRALRSAEYREDGAGE